MQIFKISTNALTETDIRYPERQTSGTRNNREEVHRLKDFLNGPHEFTPEQVKRTFGILQLPLNCSGRQTEPVV